MQYSQLVLQRLAANADMNQCHTHTVSTQPSMSQHRCPAVLLHRVMALAPLALPLRVCLAQERACGRQCCPGQAPATSSRSPPSAAPSGMRTASAPPTSSHATCTARRCRPTCTTRTSAAHLLHRPWYSGRGIMAAACPAWPCALRLGGIWRRCNAPAPTAWLGSRLGGRRRLQRGGGGGAPAHLRVGSRPEGLHLEQEGHCRGRQRRAP